MLTERDVQPLDSDGQPVAMTPPEVPKFGSTSCWEQLVMNEFKDFLDTDRDRFFKDEKYTPEAIAETNADLYKLQLAARGHGQHGEVTPVPTTPGPSIIEDDASSSSSSSSEDDNAIDLEDLVRFAEMEIGDGNHRGMYKPAPRKPGAAQGSKRKQPPTMTTRRQNLTT